MNKNISNISFCLTCWIIIIFIITSTSSEAQTYFGQPNIISDGNEIDPRIVHPADLDGDGDLDIITNSTYYFSLVWYENIDGLGNFGTPNIISANAGSVSSIFTTDVDGDGDIDVLLANGCQGKVSWFENINGEGYFGAKQIITSELLWAVCVYAADIDNDGDMDVISTSKDDNKIAWYQNDGYGNFGAQLIISTSIIEPLSVFVTDLDGDGDMDIISGAFSGDLIAWHENIDGSGNFSETQIISTLVDNVRSVLACDIDGDGDMDVVSASERDDKIAWYENNGIGIFGMQMIISTSTFRPDEVHSADIDQDGDMDIISSSIFDDKIVWHKNTDGFGAFEEEQVILITSDLRSVFPADMDGDSDIDISASLYGEDKTVWFENYTLEILEQPHSQQICPNSSTNFTILAKDVSDYQWQMDDGGGFNNLINDSTYSGVNTNILHIINGGIAMTGFRYRCILSNQAGSANSIEITLTVIDVELPEIISAHHGQSLTSNLDCEASLPDYTIDVIAIDNCDVNLDIVQIPNPGTYISGLINTVTLKVIDDVDNSTSVSFNVEVLDTLSPILLCEEDTTIKLKSEQNSYTVKETEFDPIQIEDNCNIKSIANSYNNLETLEGAEFPIGITTVNWIVTDESDNNTESSQDITVELIDDLCIYPNPTDGIFYISSALNNLQEIIIYDINGKLIIKRTTINPIELIDLRKHSSGVYVVKLFTRTGIFNRKIIKKLGRDKN